MIWAVLGLTILSGLSLVVNYRLLGLVFNLESEKKKLDAHTNVLSQALFSSGEGHLWEVEEKKTIRGDFAIQDKDVLTTEVCAKCKMVHRHWRLGLLRSVERYKDIEGFFLGGVRIDKERAMTCEVEGDE